MIHIVTPSNRHLYRAQLAEMHQLRRVHFVEERGWSDLTVIDGGEYDAFDDERTVYALALGPELNVMAGMRARPTDDKCMLTDVFPALIGPDMPPMSGHDVWEISRIFSTPAARAHRKATGIALTTDINLSLMEYCESVGIERLVGIIDLSTFGIACKSGWNVRMTGLPLDDKEGPMVGIEVANTAADIDAFRTVNSRGRVSHEVTDAEVAILGGIAEVAAEFDMAGARAVLVAEADRRPVDRSV